MSTSSCSLCVSVGLVVGRACGWEWKGWRRSCRVQHRPDRDSHRIWAGEIWFPLEGFSEMQMEEKWQPGHTTHPTEATTMC